MDKNQLGKLKAGAAGLAASTRGRARVFKDKRKKHVKDELDEYRNKDL